MDERDREREVFEAASMYYLQDETMETIARRTGVSRSTVSRLIKQARASGMVRIELHPPAEMGTRESMVLRDLFGVQTHVVTVRPASTEVQRLEQVARVAGRLVSGWMQPGSVLGIAWGNTIAAVVAQFVARAAPRSAVVQLNGAANPTTTGIPYAGAIMEAAARAFESSVHHFPVPAFFDYPETKLAMWRERSLAAVRALQARTDVALFGVGAFTGSLSSQVYAGGYLDQTEIASLQAAGVVGDICTVLLREDGTYADIATNARASGPSPAALRRIGRRVCVVSGSAKVRPTLGALRAGAVTDLVIDEPTLRALAERISRSGLARGRPLPPV
ncbi:sugar-binding transcriptional regulator [Georgenia sp. Z1491]|uniref:sugar-binding transcriptional regulator n=1 Tax=Georgenia sp. Z1491 TaxID=3416707 RepID=UPI003CEFBD95